MGAPSKAQSLSWKVDQKKKKKNKSQKEWSDKAEHLSEQDTTVTLWISQQLG